MFKCLLFFVGILGMCVPDDASLTQFVVQGLIGLTMVLTAINAMIQEEETR